MLLCNHGAHVLEHTTSESRGKEKQSENITPNTSGNVESDSSDDLLINDKAHLNKPFLTFTGRFHTGSLHPQNTFAV
jgi:hypothetical protein